MSVREYVVEREPYGRRMNGDYWAIWCDGRMSDVLRTTRPAGAPFIFAAWRTFNAVCEFQCGLGHLR